MVIRGSTCANLGYLKKSKNPTTIFDGGVGAPHKVLEAYMDEVVWPAKPSGTYLATMLWVVVVLLGQHENQLKSGLPWMEVHI